MDLVNKVNALTSIEKFRSGLITPKSYHSAITTNRVFDIDSSRCREINAIQKSCITALDIDKIENRYLLSGDDDGDIVIRDLNYTSHRFSDYAQKYRKVMGNYGLTAIKSAEWHPFEYTFITTEPTQSVKFWDARKNVTFMQEMVFYGKICGHHMSNGTARNCLIAVATSNSHVVLVDPKCETYSVSIEAHRGGAASVRWLPKSEYLLATGGFDGRIRFWDIRSPNVYLKNLDYQNRKTDGNEKAHNSKVKCLRFTDDGLFLVSQGADNCIRLWDTTSYKNTFVEYDTVECRETPYPTPIDICYNSSPPILFVPCLDCIFVYNIFTGSVIKNLVGHFDSILCCVYRYSTNELYSTGEDSKLLFWSPDYGKKLEKYLSILPFNND